MLAYYRANRPPQHGAVGLWPSVDFLGRGATLLPRILALSALALPTRAAAIDYHLCISPDNSPLTVGCDLPCDNDTLGLSTDGTEVEASVALLPDLPDGNRPWVSLCIQGPGLISHTVEVHNQGGQGGSPLFLTVRDVSLCPTPLAALPDSMPPAFRWVGTSVPHAGLPVDRLSLDIDHSSSGDCAFPSPGIVVYGGGSLEIANSVIRGAEGVAIGGIESEEATELLVTDTHVLDTKGPAIQNWSNVTIRRSEIAGSYLSSEAEGAAVVGVYGDVGSLSLATSALFGNVIEGSSLDPNPSPPVSASRPALVSGRVTQVERVLVAANVLGANASLFRVAVPDEPRMLEQDNTIALPNGPWMSNSVVARNLRIAADGEDWDLSPEDRDSSPVSNWSDNEAVGCSNLDPIHPYFHRTPALESSVSGSGALLEFESPSSAPDHPGLTLQRNFFVGNKLGASPLLRIDGAIDGLSIQLLHNTIADNGSASFLTLDNARSDARLTALKNLFAASETVAAPDRLLGTSAPIRSLISSMNAADNASIWSVADGDAETLLDGPHPTYTHPDFEPACDLQEMDDCERYQRICPSADTTDCSDQAWPELPCALDDAAGWVPTDGLLAQLGGPWPWETNFYADLRPQAAAPGATGGPCAPSRATFDSLTLHEGPWGDGDGYPDALDCDNSDPNRGSVVPAQDGYNSWFCTGAGGDCYACPEGSEPPPTADAQPTNSEAEAVEEPTAQDNTQFTSSSYLVDSGCSSGGCGVSYGCADSAAGAALPLLLFPLGWRRRRQNQ